MKWLIRLFFLGFIKPFYITTEAALLGSAAIGAFTSAGTGIASGRMNKKTRQLAEKQFNQSLAQSEKWNQISQNNYLNQAQIRVADMQKAGLNPLMYAGDSSASISGGASPTASTSTNNSVDFDGIAQVMSAYANQRLTNKSLNIQKDVENRKIKLEEDKLDFEKEKQFENLTQRKDEFAVLASQRDVELHNQRSQIEEMARHNKITESQQEKIITETNRANLQNEVFTALGLQGDSVERARKALADERDYEIALGNSIRANQRLLLDATKANVDHALQCTQQVIDVVGGVLSKVSDITIGNKTRISK